MGSNANPPTPSRLRLRITSKRKPQGTYSALLAPPPSKPKYSNHPTTQQCPDTDWTLWGVKGQLENGGWCCAADSKGTYWTSSGVSVGCASSANTTLATSQAWAQTISTSSCTATSTSTGTASTSATGSAAATATTAAASEDNGISQAAVAGIAVGSVVGVALVVVGATLLWWRRREAVAAAEDADAVEGGSGAGVPMFEMGNEERVEMDGAQVARARGVKSPTYELEGHKWTPPEER